jgi:serine/threonine protein kinase
MAEKIGRFEILGEIARGPMACVYKASDTESGQVVALKTVSLRDLGDQATAWVQRVLQEAESTKALNSPNIVLVYGAGDIGDIFCAAVEYVQGKSIANMLAGQEHFSIWDLQDIARQTCQGLDHAHSHRAVHYSLEPAKIMVSWEGTVKILGLGISQMGANLAHTTGTPPMVLHYMSPEQVRGEPLDARSNTFSLGAILYEMVTGRKAFGGEDAEQVRQEILNGMPVPPAMVLSKIVPGVSEVIMRAVCKIPEQRYASAKDLVKDLELCKESSSAPVSARKTPEPVRGLSIPQPQKAYSEPAAAPNPAGSRQAAAGQRSQRSKAAAAAAGSDQDAVGSYGFRLEDPLPVARASAVPAEAETEILDPLHATGDSRFLRSQSFSEIEELPPLREAHAAPAVAHAPEPEPAAAPSQDPPGRETFKAPAHELAKRAVWEIRKTPPKLFLYSIGGAVLLILLVIASIAHRIRSENAEDQQAPPAAGIAEPAAQAAPTPAARAASVPGTQPAMPAAPPPEAIQAGKPSRKPEIISVIPRRNRRRERAPVAAPAVVPGDLSVTSTPEAADILIDGKGNATWVTPNHISGLAPGKHTVTISKSGYVSENRTIEVAAGGKSFLVVQLAPAGASAVISSVPPGAQVLVDGKDAGHATPIQVQVQRPGAHTFLVRKSGYLDESVTANLQSGQAFQFAPVLRPLGRTDDIRYAGRFKKLFGGGDAAGTGTVTVKTDPRGAQIMVNHKMLDRLSPVQFYLNPGTYVIDITLSGYKSVHRVLNVDKDGKFTIDETLERQ